MRKHILLGATAVIVLATGCASMDDTQRRTATGAGVGALAGFASTLKRGAMSHQRRGARLPCPQTLAGTGKP